MYSIQQIKFDLLSYIKEFGGDGSEWQVGTAADAPKALFEILEVDPVDDIWLWKPALTCAAAKMIASWIIERHKASPISDVDSGNCVFLFRRRAGAVASARQASA
ncbi:MAG: hypothetical protein ACYC5H_10575 [Methylovirgula sp.]